jgi:hypothetical protein
MSNGSFSVRGQPGFGLVRPLRHAQLHCGRVNDEPFSEGETRGLGFPQGGCRRVFPHFWELAVEHAEPDEYGNCCSEALLWSELIGYALCARGCLMDLRRVKPGARERSTMR